ncbi:MAG: 2-oxo acid dehydrogenase subunit E2 [Chloroflexi bacterium]|nr:2-oxo acid dehydrogenase subunit E2 [Chloroflexota bacterium]
MPTEVIMPQLGDSVSEGTVSRWLKHEGERVEEFDPLLEVSGDKIDTEIPAPVSGVVLKILTPVGQLVTAGACLAVIGEAVEKPSPLAPHQLPSQAQSSNSPQSEGDEHHSNNGHTAEYTGYVSPVVARMVAEHQLDLAQITGTGRDGRVTKKDVQTYLAKTPSPKPLPEPTPQPPLTAKSVTLSPAQQTTHVPVKAPQSGGELVALTAMRRTIAEHMVRSKLQTAPHATTVFEFDMSAVMAHRKANKDAYAKQGVNLTLTAYLAVATAAALQQARYLNAQWTDEGIFLHNTVNLGIAVALDEGLIVPVIPNAGDLNLLGMARAVNEVATRGRGKQLKADELQGGTFTITNHGVSGSLFATPIINQPQSGILGVGVVEKRVKVIDDMIAIRPCCYVTLTFDHRVADGATADHFMQQLKDTIETWN